MFTHLARIHVPLLAALLLTASLVGQEPPAKEGEPKPDASANPQPAASAQQAEPAKPAAEESSAKDVSRSKRLEEIERLLRELLKEVETMRGPAKPPSEPPRQEKQPVPLPASWLKALQWRSIGPANMGGRIVDLDVYENDPSLYWIATASGGLLKTTNNGITFEHQFDRESTVSIGAVAVAPSNSSIVWVGTGENNPRNSVSYGDGVYKSTDGGKTWKSMGLNKSYQIGKILIHPTDPNIVYVGALGRLYGPNEEREIGRAHV